MKRGRGHAIAAEEGHKIEAEERKCKIEVLKKMDEDMFSMV